MTADGYVTPSDDPGAGAIVYLKSLIGHAEGATVGDKIVIRDTGPTGTVRALAVVSSPNGDFGQAYAGRGIAIKTPVYYSEQKTTGTIRSEVIVG